ncbi:hypothetical protein [Pontibacillus yanchengensis]|uniref:hypothetical protein n=1 Tax=Pontibacillus yanchengensis TaxID=462910 RepID=UPI001F3146A8|nr:hypothetical protein [Pontibacillus yanchengensis]
MNELEETSIKDKKEIIESLISLIPKTYGTSIEEFPDIYTQCNIVIAKPFPETVGNEEEGDYFKMAKTFCGKEIYRNSWLIRLDFLRAPGANLAQAEDSIL